MSTFKKSEMYYSDYSWTTLKGDNPKISGPPDDTMFSRNEGYEVLYLINHTLNEKGLISTTSAQKMEKLIHDELPSNIHSQRNVKKWINENW